MTRTLSPALSLGGSVHSGHSQGRPYETRQRVSFFESDLFEDVEEVEYEMRPPAAPLGPGLRPRGEGSRVLGAALGDGGGGAPLSLGGGGGAALAF